MKKKLQVFVSSTYTDMREERQAAVEAILKSGHIPAGMELFTSGDISQMETIKRWIDESDVYMLILGGRYGSIESTTRISYTELEYDYAIEQGKAAFAVVISDKRLDEKLKANGATAIERDNSRELKQFREKVLSNISSFFDDAKDIKLCVYESLSDILATRSLKGWISGDQIPDTRPLLDEISRLNTENINLRNQLEVLESAKKGPRGIDDVSGFQELRSTLLEIKLTVPGNLVGGEDEERTVLDVFFANRDIFVRGITNRAGIGDVEKFFYHNVCPKLQVHGLVSNEKVVGVTYRRYATTDLGNRFLAFLEKSLIARKKSGKGKELE